MKHKIVVGLLLVLLSTALRGSEKDKKTFVPVTPKVQKVSLKKIAELADTIRKIQLESLRTRLRLEVSL